LLDSGWFRVRRGERVRQLHQVRHLDLPVRLHLLQDAECHVGNRLILQPFNRFWADAQQPRLVFAHRLDLEIERLRDPLLGNPRLDRLRDHPMFLNRRDPIHSVIVGASLVVRRHEAQRVGPTEISKHFQSYVPIEKQMKPTFAWLRIYDERLDDPDLPYRRLDRLVTGCRLHSRLERT
jgi:hypothetical protein